MRSPRSQIIRYALFGILTQFYSLQWWSKPSEIAVFVAIDAIAAATAASVVVDAKPHSILCSSPSSQPFQFIICLSATNIMSPIVRYRLFFCSFLFCFWKCISLSNALNVRKYRSEHREKCERQSICGPGMEVLGGITIRCQKTV